jgi:CRISPR-associated endonuclease/helicase Cas3
MADTVVEAQKLYELLRNNLSPDIKLILFHSRFLLRRRMEIEHECIELFGKESGSKRPEKAILVCTQVVEQSLDLDFDGMVTQIAPIDLLLQRAGRVHRHENHWRPEKMKDAVITVLTKEDGRYDHSKPSFVYAPFLLDKTHEYLSPEKTILVPEMMREAIEGVYSVKPNLEQMEAYATMSFDNQMMRQNARGGEWPKPNADYFFATQSIPDGSDWSEDRSEFVAEVPKTREGNRTTRIAILSDDMFEQIKSKPYDRRLAKQVLLDSVSIILPSNVDVSGIETGCGVLKGCLLLRAGINGRVFINDIEIIDNPDIGISIGRMKQHGTL